jgi:hypothetical protein
MVDIATCDDAPFHAYRRQHQQLLARGRNKNQHMRELVGMGFRR